MPPLGHGFAQVLSPDFFHVQVRATGNVEHDLQGVPGFTICQLQALEYAPVNLPVGHQPRSDGAFPFDGLGVDLDLVERDHPAECLQGLN